MHHPQNGDLQTAFSRRTSPPFYLDPVTSNCLPIFYPTVLASNWANNRSAHGIGCSLHAFRWAATAERLGTGRPDSILNREEHTASCSAQRAYWECYAAAAAVIEGTYECSIFSILSLIGHHSGTSPNATSCFCRVLRRAMFRDIQHCFSGRSAAATPLRGERFWWRRDLRWFRWISNTFAHQIYQAQIE